MAIPIKQACRLIANRQGAIEVIEIDAVVSETHSHASTITDYPVEEGFRPSDHSRPEPDKVRIEGVISNTPLSVRQQQRVVASGAATADALGPQLTTGYSEQQYAKLLQWRAEGQLLTAALTRTSYESMGVENLERTVDAKKAEGLFFTLSLKRVTVVRNKVTRLVKAKDLRAKGKVKTGAQATTPAEQESSSLFDLATAGKGSNNATVRNWAKAALKESGK